MGLPRSRRDAAAPVRARRDDRGGRLATVGLVRAGAPARERAAAVPAYVRAGGPGRVTGPADASLLVASRLNFLLSQVRTALDPGTGRGDREHAEQEVDEGLRLLPAARQPADVPAAARAAQRTARP